MISALLLAWALAAEVPRFAGIDLPAGVRVSGVDSPLHLRGSAIVDSVDLEQLYGIALYADRRLRSDRDLLDALEPFQLTLVWLQSDMSQAEVRHHFTMRFVRTVPTEHYSPLAGAIERFVATLPEAKRGTTWLIEYWPDGGMSLLAGDKRQRIPGIDMSRAVLGLWLGLRAEDTRSALLGSPR